MYKDSNGNIISVNSGVVKLKLKGETRTIGTIDDKCRILYVKRDRSAHLMRANSSYGFNVFVLLNAKRFDKVRLEDEYGVFDIPIKSILEHGTYLHFKPQGFEKQIFLHINYLNQFKNDTGGDL